MKTTLLTGLCMILVGVIVGLVAPQGALVDPLRDIFGGMIVSAAAAPQQTAAPTQAVVAPVAQEAAPTEATTMKVGYQPPQTPKPEKPKAAGGECSDLTEAARQSYMSAGFATQDFATTSIMAQQDKTSQSAVQTARERYESALRTAHEQIAAASRAQCWSRTGEEPPNLAAFESSLPNAALLALER